MMKEQSSCRGAGDEHIIRDLMFCARFLRCHTDGRGSQRRVLFFLREHGPMTQKDLLDEMGVRASSMSELLSKLEAKGFVRKEKSESDKRNYNVSITDAGRDALSEMQAEHRANITDLLSDLPEEDRRQLAALLFRLRERWSERDPSLAPCPDAHHGKGRGR